VNNPESVASKSSPPEFTPDRSDEDVVIKMPGVKEGMYITDRTSNTKAKNETVGYY
jgi:hypothetical protein